MKSIFLVLEYKSNRFYLTLGVLGLVNTLLTICIFGIINFAVGGSNNVFQFSNGAILFFGLILVSFPCSLLLQNIITKATDNLVFKLETDLIEKIRNSTFESFQKLGHEKIFNGLGAFSILGRVPEMVVNLVNSMIIIICGIFYLAWISKFAALAIVVFMTTLLAINLKRNQLVEKELIKARKFGDKAFAALIELIDGFKQLKISSVRSETLFHNHIVSNKTISKDFMTKASMRLNNVRLSGIYSWYILLGGIVFVLPQSDVLHPEQVASLITTILFLMAPASSLLSFIPAYTSAKVAVDRLNEINDVLRSDAMRTTPVKYPDNFETIRFENLVYRYNSENTEEFAIHVDSFSIRKGEVVFLIGGNGSGKTTFLNLFTGLITPDLGKVFIDDKEVTWEEYAQFSNRMGVIFGDQHLFCKSYDDYKLSNDSSDVTLFKKMFAMQTLFYVDENGELNRRLSKGQQKRLSLILAMLERKPIVVLDEWAAEQDPIHREKFYSEWLEQIRAMGKTIILITHDDEYYDKADKVIKFDYGRKVSDSAHGQFNPTC